MYIKIAPGVQVWISNEEQLFINKYKNYTSFRNSDLEITEMETAKILASKSIFVRKKLDNDVQYAVNRHIRFVSNNAKKK
tara:strand:- start:1136 stop:1375 length:240 start_codon:yes stop_codon:yes gene_type:complete